MGRVAAARIGLEVLEGAPELDEHRSPWASEIAAGTKEPGSRAMLELPQHPRHREEDGQPLPRLPELVDPHADQEDDEGALDLRRHALVNDLCRGDCPSLDRTLITQLGSPRPQSARARPRRQPRASTERRAICLFCPDVTSWPLPPADVAARQDASMPIVDLP